MDCFVFLLKLLLCLQIMVILIRTDEIKSQHHVTIPEVTGNRWHVTLNPPEMGALQPIQHRYRRDTASIAELTAAVDGQVVLDCDISSQMTSSDPVTWYHNGRALDVVKAPRFRLLQYHRLEITELRPSDTGRWVCWQGDPSEGSPRGRTVQLQVFAAPEPPYILLDGDDPRPISQVTSAEQTQLTLVCVSRRSVPPTRISWLMARPGQPQVNVTARSRSVTQMETAQKLYTTHSHLSINVSRDLAGGRVTCVSAHQQLHVYQQETVLFNVQYAPRFSVLRFPSFGHPIVRGMRVNLTCSADANPPVTPFWVKDEKQLNMAGPGANDTGATLVFSPISVGDAGWYKCSALYNNRTSSSYSFLLNVIDDVETVQSSFKTVETTVGALMSLACDADDTEQRGTSGGGSPCWIRDSDTGRRVASRGNRIHFDGATYSDTGLYSCEMPVTSEEESQRRVRARSFFVKVTGQPVISKLNISDAIVIGEPATLYAEICADPMPVDVIWTIGHLAVSQGQMTQHLVASELTDAGVNSCFQASLIVHRVTTNAIGQATLVVTNQRGVDFRSVNVSPARTGHVTASAALSINHTSVCQFMLLLSLLLTLANTVSS